MEDFLKFRRMITPILIQVVYWIVTVVVVVVGLALIFGGGDAQRRLIGILVLVLGTLTVRIYAELFIVVFRMNETLSDIKDNTEPGRAADP